MAGTFAGYLLSLLLLYKYWALFLIEFSSALGPPIPSASALVASGAFASQGYFSLSAVLLVGFVGNILGDISLFFLARRFRAPILRFLKIKEKGNSGIVGIVERWLSSHARSTIAISRLFGSGSPAISALSGISDIRAETFILYAIIGEIAFTLVYSLIGYSVAIEWEDISNFAIPAVVIALAVIASFFIMRKRKKG